jgi:hypothetical protein
MYRLLRRCGRGAAVKQARDLRHGIVKFITDCRGKATPFLASCAHCAEISRKISIAQRAPSGLAAGRMCLGKPNYQRALTPGPMSRPRKPAADARIRPPASQPLETVPRRFPVSIAGTKGISCPAGDRNPRVSNLVKPASPCARMAESRRGSLQPYTSQVPH